MITGLTLPELAKVLNEQQHAKKDYTANTRAMNFTPEGKLHVGPIETTFDVAEYALRQMAEWAGIPWKYIQQMQEKGEGELLAANINRWLERDSTLRMLRTFRGLGPTPLLRAFLSDKFRALDYYDLADHVIPVLMQDGIEVLSCQVTETKLYIQASKPNLREQLRPGAHIRTGGGRAIDGPCYPLIVISNSEVGAGQLNVETGLYSIGCTNGLMVGSALRKTHVGRRHSGGGGDDFAEELFSDETREADDRALWLKVRDTVKGAFDELRFADVVHKFEATLDVTLAENTEDLNKVVEVTAKRLNLTEGEQTGFLQNLLRDQTLESGFTQFDAVNAVTRLAQDAKSYDRAIELERLGGQMLDFKKSDFTRN